MKNSVWELFRLLGKLKMKVASTTAMWQSGRKEIQEHRHLIFMCCLCCLCPCVQAAILIRAFRKHGLVLS